MPNTTLGKKDQDKRDLKIAQKLKPKLRKFLIDKQVTKAAETAQERKQEAQELLKSDDVIERATKLSQKLFLGDKLWKLYPPYLETQWMTTGLGSYIAEHEMRMDVSAFAAQLVREYRVYLIYKNDRRGYLNPMDEKNLVFFWHKFNADLKLLIEADRRRKEAGNKGVVLLDKQDVQ